MAGELVRSSLEKERTSHSNVVSATGSRRGVVRRASSSTVTPIGSSDSASLATRSSQSMAYHDAREKMNGSSASSPAFRPATSGHDSIGSGTPNFRPLSRDGINGSSSAGRSGWNHTGKHQHRIPRVSMGGARLLRTSTAPPGAQMMEEGVNGSASPSPTTPIGGERRRRRVWNAGDGGSAGR
jgi:hypothetical protein